MGKKLNYLSLFSGIGGLDYGLELAGWSNVGCIELDKFACESLRSNTKWNVYHEDIRHFDFKVILKKSKLRKGELDLLVGGPPCQSYSKSSLWNPNVKRGYADSRGKLIDHYMRAVEELLPKVFLIENVPGFFYSQTNGGMASVNKILNRIKLRSGVEYQISHQVLNCADFGVPQKRERFFLVANRVGCSFSFPKPTHGDNKSKDVKEGLLKPYKTPANAFLGLNYSSFSENVSVGGKWKELLPCVPPGQNYQFFTDKGNGPALFEYRSRYWTFLLKLSPNEPSWTLQASPGSSTGPFHWENRRLYSRELARIQTLPDWVVLNPNPRINQKLIGNAIPSLMGEILGKEIQKQMFKISTYKRYALLPKAESKVYRPRFKSQIPSQFLRLAISV